MTKRIKFLFGVSLLCLAGANSAFGDSVFFNCMPTDVNLLFKPLTDNCPAASGLPAGSTITGVKFYLLANFQGGASIPNQNVLDSIQVVFNSFDSFDINAWPHSGACNLSNQDVGTIATANTCGFYSGVLTAPGTTSLSAVSDLSGLAARGFDVGFFRIDLAGTASTVTAGNIVEYDFTTAVPEPSSIMLLFAAAGGLGLARWRRKKSYTTLKGPVLWY